MAPTLPHGFRPLPRGTATYDVPGEPRGGSTRDGKGGWRLKVFEGLSGGVEPGSAVSVAELGLPVNGTNGVLLVFWKAT